MEKKKPKHSRLSMTSNPLWVRASKRAAMLALVASLGWLTRVTPSPVRATAAITGEFPASKPDDSGEFAKLKTNALRAFKLNHKPPPKAPVKPKPVRQAVQRWSSKAMLVVVIAKQYLGVRYVWGGSTPSGFDCSGYTRYVYAKVGVNLPHRAASQAWYGRSVTEPRIGDLVFWGQPATHVGIYIGRGMFIAAPHSGTSVRIAPLYGHPYFRRIL